MSISQNTVRANRAPGTVGGIYDISHNNEETFFINAHPQAKQKTTLAVSTATANAEYKLNVNGADLLYVAPATGQTTATIAAGIAQAINADPLARAQVVATSTAATITLESAHPGLGFGVTTTDAKFGATTNVVAAAQAEPIGFGLLCFRTGPDNTELYDNRLGRLASANGLTKAVATLDVAGTDVATVTVRVNGTNYTKTGAIAALRAALTTINGITATGATTKVIITADSGASFELVSVSNATVDSQVAGTSADDLAIGVSRATYAVEADVDNKGRYPGNHGVVALRRGKIWVECTDVVGEGATVYVSLTGADQGKFYGTPAAGRVALDRNRCKFYRSRAADGLAVIDCDFF